MSGTVRTSTDDRSPAWNRWIDSAEGLFNFRDIGGYATTHGEVCTGQVYRSDSLARTPAATLAALGIKTVVDLRSDAELASDGQLHAADAITYKHCPVAHTPWDDQAATAATVQPFLTQRYLEIADTGRSGIRDTLALLADAQRRPLVFHCRAGKDRTGVLAALLLSLLGVSDDDIDTDYTLSNQAYARFCASRGDDPLAAVRMAAAMSSPPGTASAVLNSLRTKHGSIEGYMISIGVSAADLHRLKQSLTAANPRLRPSRRR